jgi:CDP-diacylglycerol--serine O-phosphatidyltransferase
MMSATESSVGKEPANPERRGLKKGLYLIPSAFTAANIGMGFYTVMNALRAFQLIGINDYARATPYLDNGAKAIGWALLFDMLDGRIARLTKTTTEIGV